MTDFLPGGPPAPYTPSAPAPAQASPQQTQARTIVPNVVQTDFSDESVTKYEFEKYGGKPNQTDRIYIPYVQGVVRGRTHFIERNNVKFSIICRSQYVKRVDGSGEDLIQEAQCCKLLGSSTPRWAVLITQYGTDRNGQPTRPFSMYRKLWIFGADKYQQIRNIGRDFPLEQHDLSVFCPADGEKYQKLQITSKPDCWLTDPRLEKAAPGTLKGMQEWAKGSVNKLARELGRTYASDADLLRDLQQAGVLVNPGASPTMVSDAPVANFDDIIVQAGGTQ